MRKKSVKNLFRSFGKTDFEGLGMKRVGPGLWLKLSHPHREIRFDQYGKARAECRRYINIGKRIGTYVDGRGGWGLTRLVMMGGFIFGVSDRLYRPRELAKRRMRREQEKIEKEVEAAYIKRGTICGI